ncbi:hypothetical protein IEE91_11830 [Kocuria sp. cx-455]|uniref:hypothetical protein n=1 Tax=Kocuria sp. cx-455 TaxID=2771377 RepID=UPI001686C71A|nr:hypothetical protein [Kocuria sp. cx-455]MBD2765866.1 hypothetical protein [Kocuria sp. cx-455]
MNMHTVTAPRSETPMAPWPVQLARTVVRRWPLLLGVAFAVFNLVTDDNSNALGGLMVLLVATTAYVVIASLDQPGWSWPVLGVLVVVIVAIRWLSENVVLELAVFAAVIIGSITVGLIRGLWKQHGIYRWQPFAAVGFVGVCLPALWLDPVGGRVLIAVGLIGHTVWDVVHWRRHAVVSRSLAEWCAALDLTLGVGMLLMLV